MSKNRSEYDKKYEEKRAGQRTRNWAVIFYPEDLPEDWKQLIDEQHVKWIEGPLHDKDVNATGEAKKPHIHALMMFESVRTLEQVETLLQGIFGASEANTIIGVAKPQMAGDRCAVVRYMAHMDNPDKAQYDVADIVGHNGADPAEILRYSATETREMIVAMEKFIEQNGITELCDFSEAIRDERQEWHTLVATKMTMYFNAFIRSRRHKLHPTVRVIVVNENGDVLEERQG